MSSHSHIWTKLAKALSAFTVAVGLLGSKSAIAEKSAFAPTNQSDRPSVPSRVIRVREKLATQSLDSYIDSDSEKPEGIISQWNNWSNWSDWNNWSNWSDWPNWGNWGNWGNW
ncbi:hypothetical protein Lepto7375DRAFT_4867 [Leptolyngbya sp. PCC 7375]|nr:hypothetical protein Lepto7375DRAFT_4867 [Leptolyngbya sp. PCC 7375]